MWAAHMEACEIDGLVVAIDIEDHTEMASQRSLWDRRVRFLHGSTVDPAIVARVTDLVRDRRTMVILDSDHHADHVRAELAAYASLVTPGCYLIVQDMLTEVLLPDHGPGPITAVEEFLTGDDRFVVDRDRECLILTMCPSGWLRRL